MNSLTVVQHKQTYTGALANIIGSKVCCLSNQALAP